MHRYLVCVLIVPLALSADCVSAQQRRGPDSAPVTLGFGETIELDPLIDLVSERLGVNIVSNGQTSSKSIQIRSPRSVPSETLLSLLEAALQAHNLILAPGADEHWYTIRPSSDLVASAPYEVASGSASASGRRSAQAPMPAPVELRIFQPEHISVQRAEQILRPFMTKTGAALIALPDEEMLIVADYADRIRRAESLLRATDVVQDQTATQFVPVKHVAPDGLAQQVKQILTVRGQIAGDGSLNDIELLHDERTSQLIVIGKPKRVASAIEIIESLDTPIPVELQPVQFYKLENAKAEEVLETIRLLEEDGSLVNLNLNETEPASPAEETVSIAGTSESDSVEFTSYETTQGARITADPHTNALIVIGDTAVQAIYKALIERLDVRRPQVMIEVTLVILDTSDSFSLGIEIGGNVGGNPEFISFSAFGLSEVDPATGSLTINPGIGFNGTLLSPDIADVVIQALQRTGRARIVSTPRILINDNAEGKISSTSQEPFETVNSFDTVATTSFGGFVDAGTTITTSPRISNGDHLALDYTVELSSFTGERLADLPPPRILNSLESSVTLPNSYTVVTGGLTTTNESESRDAIPLLGQIPFLGALFRNDLNSTTQNTLFVFIRPTILRDDKFADLRSLSAADVEAAGLDPDLPSSQPVLMQ